MKKLLFALIALCMSISANAQFYGDSSIHYYIEAGKTIGKFSWVRCVIFQGNTMISNRYTKDTLTELIKNGTLRKNMTSGMFADNNSNYHYDSEYSTSVRTTYRYGTSTRGLAQRYAFKNDKSDFKCFNIQSDGSIHYGCAEGGGMWEEIPESELLPKTPNKDFLYE